MVEALASLVRRNRLKIASLFAAFVIVGWLLVPSNRKAFDTVPVSRGDVEKTISASGTVKPLESVLIGAEVSGLVRSVFATLNSKVIKGQTLAILDSTGLQASLEQAEAQIGVAKASVGQRNAEVERAITTVRLKQSEYDRQLELLQKGFISRKAVEAAELEVSNASADLRIATMQVVGAKSDLVRATALKSEALNALSRSRILSPISGIVINRQIEQGQTITSAFQTPILFEIAAGLTRMKLEIRVDEADIGEVARGQHISFTVDAFPEKLFTGVVTQIQKQGKLIDGATVFFVTSEFDNPDEKILSGMTANAKIVTGFHKDVLRVPIGCLSFLPSRKEAKADGWLPKVSIVSREEAERIQRGEPKINEVTKTKGNVLWRLTDSSRAPIEPVSVGVGLRGDTNVEIVGQAVAIGDLIVLREK